MLARMIKKTHLIVARPVALQCFLLAALIVCANAKLLGVFAQATQELKVSVSFASKSNVLPDEAVELLLSRPLDRSEGRLAILLGTLDLTSLFTLSGNRLIYNPKILKLPLGESSFTVYLVSPTDEWKEIASIPVRVSNEKPVARPVAPQPTEEKPAEEKKTEPEATETKPEAESTENKIEQTEGANKTEQTTDAETKTEQTDAAAQDQPAKKILGFEKLDFIPSVTLTMKSQPAQTNFPADAQPARVTFTDVTMTASFRTEMARQSFNLQTQFDLAGSSFLQEALRFGELGNSAPRVDLSSYLMQYQLGKIKYLLGHTSYGTSRHLVNSFSSRGMTIAIPINTQLDFSLAAMNGTAIVGYDNFFGIARRRHQLVAGTLGMELLPKRPGGLRLESSVMQGWFQPVSGFNQGVVNDAERSKGLSFRLLASDKSQRFRLETGFTRSQFFNPADDLLNQGQNVVEVKPLWRNAQYIDAAIDIIKDRPVTKEKKLNLTFNFKHERVDPLYKSLGASTQADKIQNEFLLSGSVGEIAGQYSHQRFNDNLADIPSILKSNTRLHTFSIAFPLPSLFGKPDKPARLLPTTSYNFNRSYQFGAAIPVNGGFELDPSSIPDQIGTSQGVTADWQFEKWRVGYRINHSFQNNRQTGNDLADLSNITTGFAIGITATPTLDLNLDVNRDSARDQLARTTNRTWTVAPGFSWRMNPQMSLASTISFALAGDVAETKRNRNANFDIQYSYQFTREKDRWRKVGGQFNIRYANQYSSARDRLFGVNDLRKSQTLFVQISFTFF